MLQNGLKLKRYQVHQPQKATCCRILKVDLVVAKDWENGDKEWLLMNIFLFWGDENILEVDSANSCPICKYTENQWTVASKVVNFTLSIIHPLSSSFNEPQPTAVWKQGIRSSFWHIKRRSSVETMETMPTSFPSLHLFEQAFLSSHFTPRTKQENILRERERERENVTFITVYGNCSITVVNPFTWFIYNKVYYKHIYIGKNMYI